MTFQYGQITASSSLAFATPTLPLSACGAVVSIRAAIDALPENVANGTLDQLGAWSFENARAIGRRDLSKGMFEAFLPWLEAAIAYWSHEGDDEGYAVLGSLEDDCLDRILQTKCETSADQDLITYLGLLEAIDAPSVGKGLMSWDELEGKDADHDRFTSSLRTALLSRSPLARALAFGDGTAALPDQKLLAAFAEVRHGMAALIGQAADDSEAAEWETRCAASDDIIRHSRAQTVEGVVAKLRVAFQHIAGQAWSDHAVIDPTHPKFVSEFSDGNNRILWDCIEDLARIGGVDLSKQGADQRAMVLA
jgi:hypothetical protein